MFKNLSARALGISGGQSELIELALSYGFKGIELDLPGFADQVKSHGLPHARRLLDSAKLKHGGFYLPLDINDDDEAFKAGLATLPQLAELAAPIGCSIALVVIAPGSDLRPYHQNFETQRQRLAEVAKTLQPHGIRLGVGFESAADVRKAFAFEFMRDLDSLNMLLGMTQGDNIGLLLDSWQLQAAGTSLETVKKLKAEKIVAVQLADAAEEAASGEWQSTSRLLPGSGGVIDNAALLVTLAELGYTGPITPAPHPSQVAGKSREAIVKQAGQQLDQVWKSAGLTPAGKLQAVRQ